MRYFNTAGPIRPKDHYCFNPLERINLEEILSLIEQKKYFVLHAPRQTGKTSCLLALMEYLNNQTNFKCLYINVEAAQGAREDIRQGMNAIMNEMASRAKIYLKDNFIEAILPKILDETGYISSLNRCLTDFCSIDLKAPLVLLIDEIDSLVGDTLISVLRQIRSGYDKRPEHFPQSIILCGVRDVRDYRIHSDKEKSIITGGSAFNIKAESLRLGDFSESEVYTLLEEHTKETGQEFDVKAKELIWEYTQGQPWLVNALAYETCFKTKERRDKILEKEPITEEMVIDAKEALILRRETHLDQLADKLREERVRRVIEPIITGKMVTADIPEDDVQYLTDLGLIKRKPSIVISNPIYMEIIPRMLTSTTQDFISHKTLWYVKDDGMLDMSKLLKGFQEFFRENSESWVERFQYKEAGPQLLMQAFLQRVINSGGRIEREYGLGRGRTDLMVIWNYSKGVQQEITKSVKREMEDVQQEAKKVQREIIELKILHKSLEKTISDGLEQTYQYMDRCGCNDGHLIIFDRDSLKTWEEKIFCKTERYKDKTITVWGM
ncbi:MAG: AAA-like domain-containing protein [Desulfamplus sp.]|nr:AAA-like domain-containing protein [Desulfamplus sp.]